MHALLAEANFRDVGGLPLPQGLRLRRGLLYRGEGPARLSARQQQAVQALGIRLACDLRSAAERQSGVHLAGHETASCVKRIEFDLPNDFADRQSMGRVLLARDSSPAGAVAAMSASYAGMPAAMQPGLAALVGAIMDGGMPVLIHCTAGKDRTGVLVALLLLFIGCPYEAVEHDYLQSAIFGQSLMADPVATQQIEAAFGQPLAREAVQALVGVDRRYLQAALHRVESHWGSVESYFAAAGISTLHRAQLLQQWCEPVHAG